MPKVSVIIPVYNAELYLERCLDSVCGQTLKDIEIICVDDCSKDGSLAILNKYAQADSRIKVIDCKVNGGESKARNIGLDVAKGEYLAFVDNDDEIDLDFYEKLYEAARKNDADIAKGEVKEFDYSGKENQVGNYHELIRQTNNKAYFVGSWWTAIYRAKFIRENNIKLPEGYLLGGDMLFVNHASIHANKIAWVDGVYYYHYRREDSGDGKILSSAKVQSALKIFDMIADNLNTAYQNKIFDKDGFLYAYRFNMGGFYLASKSGCATDKKDCMKSIFNMYEKCVLKDELVMLFEKASQYAVKYFLLNHDVENLESYVCAMSFGQQMAMNLRYKMMSVRKTK